MRLLQLIDDGEIELVEYVGRDIPPYAILSHTWGPASEEVSCADFAKHTHKSKSGYSKIRSCGEQAARDGLKHFWVDTCCINKESSAELSEAINSMYAWYRQAELCYAYLRDVQEKGLFCESRWFERGWTLQELLAPADVLFFDANWSPIGFKTSLLTTISARTGINSMVLQDGTVLDTYSIAERMSWAANRQTTRIEDEAYCLMGLFDVSMPLIYGEGRKAFVRLQEELLKRSGDASIFAFVSLRPSNHPGPTELRIQYHGSDVSNLVVSEHFDSDSNVIADEEQVVGTIGLYSSSPTYFREAAKYLPYPMLEKVLKQSNLRPRPSLSGHLVKLQVALWKVPLQQMGVLDMQCEMPESALQEAILKAHGIKLTTASIWKLRKCAQAVDMSDWRIAFFDCRRRAGGIVGMLLQESSTRGIYIRHHFPSIIESESLNSFHTHHDIESVSLIYVEGDSLRIDHKHHYGAAQPELLQPASIGSSYNQTVLRAINLHEYGLVREFSDGGSILQQAVFYSSNALIPVIALAAQLGYQQTLNVFSQGDEQGVACTLFPNRGIKYANFAELNALKSLKSVFVPSYRGSTISMPLTDELQLVLKSQMRWKREDTLHHVDRMRKQCLLSLSVVRIDEATGDGALLEDPTSRAPLLNVPLLSALGRHLPIFARGLDERSNTRNKPASQSGPTLHLEPPIA